MMGLVRASRLIRIEWCHIVARRENVWIAELFAEFAKVHGDAFTEALCLFV